MNIGILTYHRACNYGAYLQACALCTRLNMEKGIFAEIIDFRMEKEAKFYSSKRWSWKRKLHYLPKYLYLIKQFKVFEAAAENEIMHKSEKSLLTDSEEEFRNFVYGRYDLIVAGSDEIWKLNGRRGYPTPYWLFGDLGCKKMSYAASSRSDFSELSEQELEKLRKNLNSFEFIGVRDIATLNALKPLVENQEKLKLCCDPSFLYDFSIEHKSPAELLQGKAKLTPDKKTIVLMTEDKKLAAEVRQAFSKRYNLVSVFEWQKGYRNVWNLSPAEWLQLIANADYVITSYFHAVCFSIVNNVPFIAVGTKSKFTKLEELLLGTDLEGRYLKTENQSDIQKILERDIDVKLDFSEFVKDKRKSFEPFLQTLHSIDGI